jgi:hypothetical protein
MIDEDLPASRDTAADCDRVWDAGAHFRELAAWLRGVAARCPDASTQHELLDLADL